LKNLAGKGVKERLLEFMPEDGQLCTICWGVQAPAKEPALQKGNESFLLPCPSDEFK